MNRINQKKHNRAYPVPVDKREARNNNGPVFIKSLLLSLAVSAITALVLLLILSAVTSGLDDPEKYASAVGIVSLLLSSFAGGFVLRKLSGIAPLLCGLIVGCLIAVVSLAASAIIVSVADTHATYPVLVTVALRIATVPVAMLGAKVNFGYSSNRKRHRKSR